MIGHSKVHLSSNALSDVFECMLNRFQFAIPNPKAHTAARAVDDPDIDAARRLILSPPRSSCKSSASSLVERLPFHTWCHQPSLGWIGEDLQEDLGGERMRRLAASM